MMKAEKIKEALKDNGYDMSMIARALNKSPSLVSKVINGKARSLPVTKAVAKVLGKKVAEVFPNQYDPRSAADYKQSDAYLKKQEELRRLLNQD